MFKGNLEDILRAVHPLLSDSSGSVADNACGAVARILDVHTDRLAVADVLNALLQHLPLRQDWEEMGPVVTCLCHVATGVHAERVGTTVPAMVQAVAACALEERAPQTERRQAAQALQAILAQHMDARHALPQGSEQRLSALLQSDG